MYFDCRFCQAMAKSERAAAGPAVSVEVPALVLIFRPTGERLHLCKACADQWEQAVSRFASSGLTPLDAARPAAGGAQPDPNRVSESL